MFIEIIKFDKEELIIKVGDSEESCRYSVPIFIKNTTGLMNFYPLIIASENRTMIEDRLKSNIKSELIQHFYADGRLHITEL